MKKLILFVFTFYMFFVFSNVYGDPPKDRRIKLLENMLELCQEQQTIFARELNRIRNTTEKMDRDWKSRFKRIRKMILKETKRKEGRLTTDQIRELFDNIEAQFEEAESKRER